MSRHDANNAFEQQISSEMLARHNQRMAEEARACNAPLEQFKLGHALHVHIEAQTKAAERKKYEAEQADKMAILEENRTMKDAIRRLELEIQTLKAQLGITAT